MTAHYTPHRVAHFESGNYIIMGLFIDELEFIVSPHVDFNYLISENYIDSWDFNKNIAVKGTVRSNTLFYTKYGINLALKTKSNLFIECGAQYLSTNNFVFSNSEHREIQFMCGIGYRYTFK